MKIIKNFLSKKDRLELVNHHKENINNYVAGRQGTGYKRLHVKSMFDALNCPRNLRMLVDRALNAMENPDNGHTWTSDLVFYPKGSFIPRHLDDAKMFGLTHNRLNAIVKLPLSGGKLLVNDKNVDLGVGDAYVFLPDEEPHEVMPITNGERIILTVGCWK